MTTQISTKTPNSYAEFIWVPYTGTSDQPDAVSIFYKDANGSVSIQDEALHNSLDYNPLNFCHAMDRVQVAAYRIFLCIQGKDNDLWNACKNLTRGVVAMIPLVGNGALYLYDTVKSKFFTHPQLTADLKSQTGPILGIAFDGKIVTTFPLEKFNAAMKGECKEPLPVLTYLWLSLLCRAHKEDAPETTRAKVAIRLADMINARSLRI